MGPGYLRNCCLPYKLTHPLKSAEGALRCVLPLAEARLMATSGRASSVVAPLLCNSLRVGSRVTPSLLALLFHKAFPPLLPLLLSVLSEGLLSCFIAAAAGQKLPCLRTSKLKPFERQTCLAACPQTAHSQHSQTFLLMLVSPSQPSKPVLPRQDHTVQRTEL